MNEPLCATLEVAAAPREAQATTHALWQCYRHHQDSQTEGNLVRQYAHLVKTLVGRLAMTLPTHVSQDDLHSAGMLGLLQALRSFDAAAGASFETFARFRIRGAIFDELRRMDWVPRLVHDKSRKIQNAIAQFEQQRGRTPNEAETAAALGIPVAEYERWLEEVRPVTFVCLDAASHPGQDEGGTLHESIVDEAQEDPSEGASQNELKDLILERLEALPRMQKQVLALYYLEGLRLREIAAAFGVTESRISQIHSQAILTLRTFLGRYEAPAGPA